MTQPESPRVIIRVTAGILPEQPLESLTQEAVISASAWEIAQAAGADATEQLLAAFAGWAQGYGRQLMLNTEGVKWVQINWTWVEAQDEGGDAGGPGTPAGG